MAKRQDSGSGSAHQAERPARNEDAVPENTEQTRGTGSDDEDFDELDDDNEDDDDQDEEENEGSF